MTKRASIILLQPLHRHGGIGDIIDVRPGFARNWLIPRGVAKYATADNINEVKSNLIFLRAVDENKYYEATEKLSLIKKIDFVFIRNAYDSGNLFGSVSSSDIVQLALDEGVSLHRNSINITNKIKKLGRHEFMIDLHPNVQFVCYAYVFRSEDEKHNYLTYGEYVDYGGNGMAAEQTKLTTSIQVIVRDEIREMKSEIEKIKESLEKISVSFNELVQETRQAKTQQHEDLNVIRNSIVTSQLSSDRQIIMAIKESNKEMADRISLSLEAIKAKMS